jgi:glycosyltransferase involved in cell wall biosynthesis
VRILWLLPEFNCTSAARQASLVVPELVRAGNECRVAALRGGGPFIDELKIAGVDAVELSSPHDLPLRSWWNLHRMLRSWRPEVVHIWRKPVARALKFLRWVGHRPHVVLSQVDRNEVIPMAVGPPTLAGSRDPHLISCLGRFDRAHNFFQAIWAFDVLHMVIPELRLELTGAGPEHDRLEKFARSGHDHGNAVTLRPASRDAIRRLGEAAMVWIPSRGPAGIQVALEAQAAGTPVLASDLPTLAAVIDDGKSGVLVPTGDPVGWAKAARRLFENPGELQRLGEGGRVRAAKHSPADIASRWLAAY